MATCFPTICAYFTHTHISAHSVGCCLCLKTRNEFPLPTPSTRPVTHPYTSVTVFVNSAVGFHPVTSDTYPVVVILWIPLELSQYSYLTFFKKNIFLKTIRSSLFTPKLIQSIHLQPYIVRVSEHGSKGFSKQVYLKHRLINSKLFSVYNR